MLENAVMAYVSKEVKAHNKNCRQSAIIINRALRDLVPFKQLKKREKHCTNGSKLRKAFYFILNT